VYDAAVGEMSRVRTVSARLALPLVHAWKQQGRDVTALLAPLGLVEGQLRALRGRVSVEAWSDLHAACTEQSGDPGFALRAVERLSPSAFPLELHLAGSQPTVRAGLMLVQPYASSTIDDLELGVSFRGHASRVEFRLGQDPLGPPLLAEYLLAMLWGFVRAIAPSAPPPLEVRFTHRWPRHGEATAAVFHARVSFGSRDVGFSFDARNLELPVASADPEFGEMLAGNALAWLGKEAAGVRLRERARHWLATHLGEESALAPQLAAAMHLSERSLRRRLQEEGTSLRKLIEDVRRDRAIALLEAGARTLDDIALELGFSSASAFGRAFRAWTGTTPSSFKRRVRSFEAGSARASS
jgi:AraC-like DNA-binding protein